MKRDFKIINEELLKHQKKWFKEIVIGWIEKRTFGKGDNSLVERTQKYFMDNYETENYSFSEPFFTGVYELSDKELPLVLFVGQEANGWGTYDSFAKNTRIEEEIKDSQSYVYKCTEINTLGKKGEKIPYKGKFCDVYNSCSFWKFIREIYKQAQGIGKPINVVWTELDKIHYCYKDKKGNHCVKLWEEDEKELNGHIDDKKLTMLQYEIETIKPDLVVFLTGPAYEKSMKGALPKTIIKKPNNECSITEIEGLKMTKGLWTYHPRYLSWKNNQRLKNEAIERIVEAIKKI